MGGIPSIPSTSFTGFLRSKEGQETLQEGSAVVAAGAFVLLTGPIGWAALGAAAIVAGCGRFATCAEEFGTTYRGGAQGACDDEEPDASLPPMHSDAGIAQPDAANASVAPDAGEAIDAGSEPAVCPPIEDLGLDLTIHRQLDKQQDERILVEEALALTLAQANKLDVKTLSGIECFTNVRILDMNENDIANLSPIAALASLEILNMRKNRIVDIEPIRDLRKLTNVSFEDNRIEDISAMEVLPDLKIVVLTNNRIADISPLLRNPGIGPGDRVKLTGNPVPQKQLSALENKGVIVEF